MSLAELAARLGLSAADDHAWLEPALEHPSYAHERRGDRGNERLEFLGDAALDLVVSDLLFSEHPEWDEGRLTRARASLVNTKALASRARAIELGRHVRLGRTELRGRGEEKTRILANVFEALVGASYLAQGYESTRTLVVHLFGEQLRDPALGMTRDPKTELQEWAHAELAQTPRYALLSDSGVDEASDRFEVAVKLGGDVVATATGRSKREAERAAATAALRSSRAEPDAEK